MVTSAMGCLNAPAGPSEGGLWRCAPDASCERRRTIDGRVLGDPLRQSAIEPRRVLHHPRSGKQSSGRSSVASLPAASVFASQPCATLQRCSPDQTHVGAQFVANSSLLPSTTSCRSDILRRTSRSPPNVLHSSHRPQCHRTESPDRTPIVASKRIAEINFADACQGLS